MASGPSSSIAGRAASGVADGSGLHEAARLVPDQLSRPHSVAIDPRSVPVERKVPVEGITIAGNLTDLLASVTGVGTDLTFGPSGVGSPTLVIAQLSIGGV